MTRHVDLRYYGDVALLGIGHNVACLLLGIESAMRRLVVQVGIGAEDRTRALRSDLRQSGIALDFDTPALIVRQMPVEGVHVVKYHQIDELLDEVNAPEMA